MAKIGRIKGYKRYWRIVNLFLGFIWDYWMETLQRQTLGYQYVIEKRPQLYRKQAIRFCNTAIEFGGLLIKLGQFFSTRVDILPKEFTEELAKLQDAVPPVDIALIKEQIEQELGRPAEEVFAFFDDNVLAAASLGQVHKAILPSGEVVAVKTLRPGIADIIEIDLSAFRRVLNLIEVLTDWGQRFDLIAVYREFSITVREELDYVKEGHNAETIAKSLKKLSGVHVPKVYWDFTSRRVLTAEFIDGIKINDYATLEAVGINRKKIALKVLETYMQQIVRDGFYHADPHPGNLFVLPNGDLTFIDFGMVGRVTPKMKQDFRRLVIAIAGRNVQQVVRVINSIGFLRPEANMELVERGTELLLDYFYVEGRINTASPDFHALAAEIEEFVHNEPFQIPNNFIFLGRAVGTLLGLCTGLDSEFNFIKSFEPFAKDLLKEDEEASLGENLLHKVQSIGGRLVALPELLEKTLIKAADGNMHVKVDGGSLGKVLENQEKAIKMLAKSVVFAALLISSVVLLINNFDFEARIGFALTVLAGGVMFWAGRGTPTRTIPRHAEMYRQWRETK